MRRLAVSLGLLLLLTSCRDDQLPEVGHSNQVAAETDATSDQCERMLDNLMDGLAPGRFGISSDRGDLVNTLNNWLEQCADPESFSTSEEDAALRKRLLPEAVYTLTAGERFTNRDAEYFRNIMLVRAMVDATLYNERTDLQRAVSLFYKVVRSIDLRPSGEGAVPFSPYETALFGTGTAADRAWLFGLMLRQLRLDAVVIRPRAAEFDESKSFLVGVIVPDEDIYLFDFQLGLPITSPADEERTPLPRNPVSLAAAREDDEVLRQYDVRGATYPVTAGQLADVEVLAFGESSTWSPRFGMLQTALPVSLELFDGLAANPLREYGLIERIIRAGQGGLWSEEAVGIWSYPDQVAIDALQRTPEQQQLLEFQAAVLEAPLSVNFKQQGEEVVAVLESPSQNLHQGRIMHLQGDFQAALRVYLRTRLAVKQVDNQPIPQNVYGSDWAAYWSALAQYEQEDYAVAAQSLERYLRVPASWTIAARFLMAKSLAHEQKYGEAAQVLARETVRAPQRVGNQWLVRRWRKLDKDGKRAEEAEPANEDEPSPPAADSPAADEDASPGDDKPSPPPPQDSTTPNVPPVTPGEEPGGPTDLE